MPSTTALPFPCQFLRSTSYECPRDYQGTQSSLSQTRVGPQFRWRPSWRCGCPGRRSSPRPRWRWHCSQREGIPFPREFHRPNPLDRCSCLQVLVEIHGMEWSALTRDWSTGSWWSNWIWKDTPDSFNTDPCDSKVDSSANHSISFNGHSQLSWNTQKENPPFQGSKAPHLTSEPMTIMVGVGVGGLLLWFFSDRLPTSCTELSLNPHPITKNFAIQSGISKLPKFVFNCPSQESVEEKLGQAGVLPWAQNSSC